ncbi:Uncharacterised protein [Chryseobacterium gleum]|uniref:Uncharacterized protein n=2 Tax=Chryseobacterium gleum TaxID=250 RepID=A0A3S4M8A1_CHRGE|nr:hypothetical protein [Chryseobacterium gleum]EFK37719.1 hypothetical protein HMPREF0204_10492 [Chryseobacterium gleum ATCC 35910]QQY32802.1 hypothetical protein I6I60_03165 [Chryseobacterium gleum]VEE09959.1 Uncharacterised protein [Chryseobacterium gleum]
MNNLKLKSISISSIVIYLLKVWIFTNIISSFCLIIIEKLTIEEKLNKNFLFQSVFWELAFYITIIGLVLSIPTIIILALLMKMITNNKLIIILVSILLISVTFYFTGSMSMKNTKMIIPLPPFIYSIISAFLILIINFRKNSN